MLSSTMSWVKLLASGSEDVFDEDTDDLSLQNKEWNHNMEKRVKVMLICCPSHAKDVTLTGNS